MSGLIRRLVPLVSGGINEAAADFGGMQDSESLALENAFFDTPSTVKVRAGSVDGDRLMDDQGIPAAIDSIPFLRFFASKNTIFVVGHSTVTDKHYVYETDTDGKNITTPGSDISPVAIPAAGGFTYAVAAPVRFSGDDWPSKKFYAADVNGAIGMIRYDGDLQTVTFPTYQLGAGPASPLRPRKLFRHSDHMIALGYGDENTPYQPDILRISAAGDPDQWDAIDFFQIGDSEEPLVNGLSVGQFAILFKQFSVHRMSGSSRLSFQFTEIDPSRGGVGPNCATYYDDWVWFLSGEGFARIGAGGPSELLVDKAKLSFASFDNLENCWVEANPIERCVVFACHEVGAGGTFPTLLVQLDTRTGRYTVREYLVSGPATLETYAAARIPQAVPVAAGLGPSGPPTIGAASAISGTGWTSNWTNGDLTGGTTTRHETRNMDTGGPWTEDAVETVPTASTVLSGKTPGTEYEERVRHERSGIFSDYDPSGGSGQLVRTDPPAAPTLSIIAASAGGITLRATHGNALGVGDIQIEMAVETAPCPDASPTYSLVDTITNAGTPEETTIGGILCDVCYTFRAKWVRTGFTDSAYSSAVNVVACTGGP